MASIFPSRRSTFSPVTSSYAISFQPASSASATVASASSAPFVTRTRNWQISLLRPSTPLHRPPYNLPIARIDSFFQDVSTKRAKIAAGIFTPELEPSDFSSLTLRGVPSSAVPYVERRLDYLASGPFSCAKSGKLDYNIATQTLIISCATFAHEHMSRIDSELLELINANDRDFYGTVYRDNPAMEIVAAGSAAIPLSFAPGLTRQPDGSLRLLGHPFPFMVWEILDHMRLSDMPRKLKEYFAGTRGRVRIVMIIKLERQQPPKKRKREVSDDEDDQNASQGAPVDRNIEPSSDLVRSEMFGSATPVHEDDEEPELPPLPPPVGSLIRGVFWVYGCQRTATPTNPNSSKIVAIQTEQEFYPQCPTTHLRLRWADVLSGGEVPVELADKFLDIPYSFLHDRFRRFVQMQHNTPAVQWGEDMSFDLDDDIPGMSDPAVPDSDPSERSAAEDSGPDTAFKSRAAAAGIDGEPRVTRLRVSQAAERG